MITDLIRRTGHHVAVVVAIVRSSSHDSYPLLLTGFGADKDAAKAEADRRVRTHITVGLPDVDYANPPSAEEILERTGIAYDLFPLDPEWVFEVGWDLLSSHNH